MDSNEDRSNDAAPTESPVNQLPGFRERGQQVTRTEAFVDAAFAFAVTLLVISLGKEIGSLAELFSALKRVPAFAASFALVAMIWCSHNTWSRRYGLDDRQSVVRSLILVFLVLVWVYPLKMMFGAAFAWLSEMALPKAWQTPFPFEISDRQNPWADIRIMYVIYGVAWCSLCLSIAGLYRHAWRRRELLDLHLEEQVSTRSEIATWHYANGIGVLSIVLALTIEPGKHYWLYGAPGMIYFLMSFTGIVATVAERRARRTLS